MRIKNLARIESVVITGTGFIISVYLFYLLERINIIDSSWIPEIIESIVVTAIYTISTITRCFGGRVCFNRFYPRRLRQSVADMIKETTQNITAGFFIYVLCNYGLIQCGLISANIPVSYITENSRVVISFDAKPFVVVFIYTLISYARTNVFRFYGIGKKLH